jgi:putative ABC transport system ATP-binding protein
VEAGEMLGIVGSSGSGKSTLMNILGGMDRPSAGRLRVTGRDLLKLSDAALDNYRLTTVGFVWQQSARNLIPYLNAVENVEAPLLLYGYVGRSKRKRAEELLDLVGLVQREGHHLSELSGGEQQRVAIAVALANNPRLLLADEPTGEVDESTALQIYATFRRLNQELSLTTLIVSHDPNLAHHVDRVVAIRDGKITSESVWQAMPAPADNGLADGAEGAPAERQIQELTVLDSAGRLQLPKEFLEEYHIQGRVQLERSPEGILIRPVAQTETRSAESLVTEMDRTRKPGRLHRLFNNIFNPHKPGEKTHAR